MRLGPLVALGSVLLMSTASLASPRLHRGPTAPKLFKARTPPQKRKAQASVEPERDGSATEPAKANAEAAAPEPVFAGELLPSSPANQ